MQKPTRIKNHKVLSNSDTVVDVSDIFAGIICFRLELNCLFQSGGLFQNMDKNVIPRAECLKDTVERVLPFWYDSIVPQIKVNNPATIILPHIFFLTAHKIRE